MELFQNKLNEFAKTLEVLNKKKDEFEGIKQHTYIEKLINTRYRITCCNSLNANIYYDNLFKNIPEVEKVFCANIFMRDLERMYEQIERIRFKYRIEGIEKTILKKEEKNVDDLVKNTSEKYTQKDITDIFRNSTSMNLYIDLVRNLRERIMNVSDDIESKKTKRKKKEQQKKEKYANITKKEQRHKIKKINDASFDITQSYKDIITYEKEVAEAKGLLGLKNEIETEDISTIRINNDEIYSYLQEAKESGVRCTILPNVDDKKDSTTLIVTTKGKEGILKSEMEYTHDDRNRRCSEDRFHKSFMQFIKNSDYNKKIEFDRDGCVYLKDKLHAESNIIKAMTRDVLKNAYHQILKMKTSQEDIQDIKFYIEMPLIRPMVPILEKLKEEEIEYYIPPIDEKTSKYKPTKKIYMDRKDIERYKKKVHKDISNTQTGIITIGAENINIQDLILNDLKEYFEKKEKEK